VHRVPAAEVETLVAQTVRERLGDSALSSDRDLISTHVVRVEVRADRLAIELNAPPQRQAECRESGEPSADHTGLLLPWRKTPSKRRREIIVPKSTSPQDARPIRAETRGKLVASIARGRRWLDEIVAGTVTDVEQIAARKNAASARST
jgi:site-specific DNA recombinase